MSLPALTPLYDNLVWCCVCVHCGLCAGRPTRRTPRDVDCIRAVFVATSFEKDNTRPNNMCPLIPFQLVWIYSVICHGVSPLSVVRLLLCSVHMLPTADTTSTALPPLQGALALRLMCGHAGYGAPALTTHQCPRTLPLSRRRTVPSHAAPRRWAHSALRTTRVRTLSR